MSKVNKFRSWDKIDKKFIYSDWKYGTVSFWDTIYNDYENRYEPEIQYINYDDKNGTPLYEGDIVKFHYFYMSFGENMGAQESEHELTGVVEFGNFGWGLNAIEGEHWCGYTGYKNGEGSSNFLDLMAMSEGAVHEESFEVIGHIYEEKI